MDEQENEEDFNNLQNYLQYCHNDDDNSSYVPDESENE